MILIHQENVQLAVSIIIQEGAPKTHFVENSQVGRIARSPGEIEASGMGHIAKKRGSRRGCYTARGGRLRRSCMASGKDDKEENRRKAAKSPGSGLCHRDCPCVEADPGAAGARSCAVTKRSDSLRASWGFPSAAYACEREIWAVYMLGSLSSAAFRSETACG